MIKIGGCVLAVIFSLLIIASSIPAGTLSEGGVLHSLGQTSENANSNRFIFGNGNPSSQVVIPHFAYQFEPAPMGIVDYGLGQPAGLGAYYTYQYNTTKFLGVVNVTSLSTYYSSANITYNLSIQLNLNLVFWNNNSLFVYWVQDVAFLNSYNNSVQFIDNIWNFSSPGSNMSNSTIVGNGTIGKAGSNYFYYDLANASLPGNNIRLKEPYTIQLLALSTLRNGVPTVLFEYNDGFSWVVYDVAKFKFATHPDPDVNFYVDGSVTNPIGTYYDAELILGGPGNGSSTADIKSSVQMSLEYWNGHNFQTIPGAFNFGSDTAETIWNVVSRAYYDDSTGYIFTNVTNGSGSLAQLYYPGELSFLNITTGLKSGNLSIGGLMIPFVNSIVNVTIGPGNYSLRIYDSNGLLVWSKNVSLAAGKVYSLIAKTVYNVTFIAQNLPLGVQWSINVSGIGSFGPFVANRTSIQLPNGTYNYSAFTQDKNYRSPLVGSLVVKGSSVTVLLNFTLVTYQVAFMETGLPPGIEWSVAVKGITQASNGSTVIFLEPNGSYLFQVHNTSGYSPNVTNGPFTVRGSNVVIKILFIYYVYLIGNVTPLKATLVVDGKTIPVNSGHFNVTLIPGAHKIKISSPGYQTYSENIIVNNTSKVVVLNVSLQKSNQDVYYAIGAIVLIVLALIVMIARRRR
ncbi:MAG: thermopsin family protease [Thermoplasmata archaeon]